MRVWRTEAGDPTKGQFVDYKLEEDQGMLVLDMLRDDAVAAALADLGLPRS